MQATRDTGGFLGSETRQGQSGTVVGSTMFGEHYQLRWDDGHVTETTHSPSGPNQDRG
ncbi:MAG: hypothetical protein ACRDSH_25990 [Pseudonocardiaceae bacterium]